MKQFEEPTMKTYRGLRDMSNGGGVRGTCRVWIGDKPLKTIGVSAFEWGYQGRYPHWLATAILVEYFGCKFEELDYSLIKKFRQEFVEQFPFEGWQVAEWQIDQFVDNYVLAKNKEESKNGK
jgi:hypothetical protein